MNNGTVKEDYSRKLLQWTAIAGLITSLLLSWLVISNIDSLVEMSLRFRSKADVKATANRIGADKLQDYKQLLSKDMAAMNKKLASYMPDKTYLIVNTSGNDFRLMENDRVVREGMCSTGSYTVLKLDEKKQWTFKTPRGMFKILNKVKGPVWKKPDWAFIEEGMKVPSPNHPSRFEYGVLGDYSLSLGQGYLIHGTLYKRYLGMPVTHGCVRMGDDDLEAVYKSMKIGSKVYIY
jgi:L,D-transpeptidase ErfK/SrfK